MKSDLYHKSPRFRLPEHYRPRQASSVWQKPLANWKEKLKEAVERATTNHAPSIFFRADDIGAGGQAFQTLCNLFQDHNIPVAMSVVPAWLSAARQEQLFKCAALDDDRWGWHQHGWRHVNWQRTGRKSEFGDHRPLEKQWRDIWQGREKMLRIFGEHFVPVFTPPWNRLSKPTLRILHQLDFKGISMSPPLPRQLQLSANMKKIKIHVDLHTRKGKDKDADFQKLLAELETQLSKKDIIGIMVHHQRMTHYAFEFLDFLLSLLKDAQSRFLNLREIIEDKNER